MTLLDEIDASPQSHLVPIASLLRRHVEWSGSRRESHRVSAVSSNFLHLRKLIACPTGLLISNASKDPLAESAHKSIAQVILRISICLRPTGCLAHQVHAHYVTSRNLHETISPRRADSSSHSPLAYTATLCGTLKTTAYDLGTGLSPNRRSDTRRRYSRRTLRCL